jgi:hypothetical protein
MTARAVLAAAFVWGATALLSSAAPAQEAARPTIAAIADALETEAEAYLNGQSEQSKAAEQLQQIKYDEESIRPLTAALRSPRKMTTAPYVANRLLEPLLSADPKIVARMATTLRLLHARGRRFLPLPSYSKQALTQYQIPPFNPRATAETVLRQMDQIQKRRLEKVAKEQAVIRYNREVMALEKKLVRLLLRVGDPQYDRDVLSVMTAAERSGHATYAAILGAMADSAEHVDAERAELLYTALESMGSQMRMKKKKYVHPAEAKLRSHENSEFAASDDFPGIRLLSAANEFAAKANKPRIQVPTKKEVDQYLRRKREEEKRRKERQKKSGKRK